MTDNKQIAMNQLNYIKGVLGECPLPIPFKDIGRVGQALVFLENYINPKPVVPPQEALTKKEPRDKK